MVIDRIQRRLLLALGASLLLHVWMVRTGEGSGARRVTAAAAASSAGSISATIQAARDATPDTTSRPAMTAAGDTAVTQPRHAPPVDWAASPAPVRVPPVPRTMSAAEPDQVEVPASNAGRTPATTSSANAIAVMPQPPAAREGTAVMPALLPQPGDATYYTARSLDVYPRAMTALDLGPQASPGKARATVLIDESGTVNEVRAIEAGAADIASALRDLLLRTRFTPASKDGRLVKAQLLVSVDYGAPDRR